MPLELAVFLSALASAALSIGLYLMKVRAPALPSLGTGFRWRSWLEFLRDPGWRMGLLLQTGGDALYFAVLRYTPLSLVHTALTGGLVLFLFLAVFWLGEPVTKREWIGAVGITLGLIFLGLSLEEETSRIPAVMDMIHFASACVVAATLALVLDRQPRRPIGTSVACGVLLGLAAVFAKVLAMAPSVVQAIHSLALWFALGANIGGFALMQSALQNGRGVVVVPIFAVLSDVVPIVAGLLVFGESLPQEPTDRALRLAAFALAVVGTGLLATSTEPHTVATQPSGGS